jgi:hypothetical protein
MELGNKYAHMHIWSFNLHRRRTNLTEIRGSWHRHNPHILRGDHLPTAFPKGTSLYGPALPPILFPAGHEVGEEAVLVIQIWR